MRSLLVTAVASAAIILPGCATYSLESSKPDGSTCNVSVNSTRDLSGVELGLGKDCAIKFKTSTIETENISEAFPNLPALLLSP